MAKKSKLTKTRGKKGAISKAKGGKRLKPKKAHKSKARKSKKKSTPGRKSPLRMTTLKSARKEKLVLPQTPSNEPETKGEQHNLSLIQVLGSD